jgi:hypothetical protein
LAAPPPTVEWEADLTIEYEERRAAKLVFHEQRCILEIESISAFKSLAPSLACWKPMIEDSSLNGLARLLPESLEIVLHGISIGQYQASAPLNWMAKNIGLPFGSLTINKLDLLRASLKGD